MSTLQFQWDVTGAGYHWVEGLPLVPPGAPKGLYLTERSPGRAGRRVRRYEPLREYTGLFRTFADTEATPEGILQFASAHGLLGVATPFKPADRPNAAPPRRPNNGECLRRWQTEITRLRGVVLLWDLLRANDVARLKAHIVWEGRDKVRFDDHSSFSGDRYWDDSLIIASLNERNPDLLQRLMPGDVVEPAWLYLLDMVNAHLEAYVTPALGWSDGKARLAVRPNSLLGAFWIQLGKAIDGDKDFRQCLECGTWFEISTSVARSDKAYCSNACRVRAYQKRKIEARQLHQEGLSFDEIAKKLQSDPQTVRGWIGDVMRR